MAPFGGPHANEDPIHSAQAAVTNPFGGFRQLRLRVCEGDAVDSFVVCPEPMIVNRAPLMLASVAWYPRRRLRGVFGRERLLGNSREVGMIRGATGKQPGLPVGGSHKVGVGSPNKGKTRSITNSGMVVARDQFPSQTHHHPPGSELKGITSQPERGLPPRRTGGHPSNCE